MGYLIQREKAAKMIETGLKNDFYFAAGAIRSSVSTESGSGSAPHVCIWPQGFSMFFLHAERKKRLRKKMKCPPSSSRCFLSPCSSHHTNLAEEEETRKGEHKSHNHIATSRNDNGCIYFYKKHNPPNFALIHIHAQSFSTTSMRNRPSLGPLPVYQQIPSPLAAQASHRQTQKTKHCT